MTAHPLPVHAILLNWNRCDDTLACLASLQASTYAALRLLVVDQNSSDDSPARIRERFPEVDVLTLPQNLGFAGGMNAGLRHALQGDAAYFLLINNDTIAAEDMVTALVAQVQPGVGIVAPAIFYHDAPEMIWSTGGGIHPRLLEMTGNHGRDEALPHRPVQRAFLSGCAMLMPRATIEQVGLWDERFFMYYEDLDYCLRTGEQHLRLVLAPEARLWHKVSASSGGSDSPQERYLMARSSGLYFRKHMTPARMPAIVAWRAASALRWSGRLLRQGRIDALKAYWRGLAEGWLSPVPAPQDTKP